MTQKFLLGLGMLCYSAIAASADYATVENAFNQGFDDKVIELVEAIPNTERNAEVSHYYVMALLGKDLDDAESAADDALEQFPNEYRLYMTHASVMGAQASDSIFSALGYAKKALNSLEKAVELAPDEPNAYSGLLGFHLNAPSIAGGDLEEASKLVSKIGTLDTEAGVHASIRLANAQEEDIEPLLDDALKRFPGSLTLLDFAAGFHNSKESHEQAFALYRQITSFEPEFEGLNDKELKRERSQLATSQMMAHYQIGRIAVESKLFSEQGIEHLHYFLNNQDAQYLATRNLPSSNWANLRLAELYLQVGDKEQARATFVQIKMEDEKNFKKAYKSLKKQL